MLLFSIIAALVIAILAVVFAVQNVNAVFISFLAWQLEGSLALILSLTFVLGFITGLLLLLPKFIKGSLTISSQKKKIEESQKNLEKKEELKVE